MLETTPPISDQNRFMISQTEMLLDRIEREKFKQGYWRAGDGKEEIRRQARHWFSLYNASPQADLNNRELSDFYLWLAADPEHIAIFDAYQSYLTPNCSYDITIANRIGDWIRADPERARRELEAYLSRPLLLRNLFKPWRLFNMILAIRRLFGRPADHHLSPY